MDVAALIRERAALEGEGWLQQLISDLSSPPVGFSGPAAPEAGRRSTRRTRPPARLSPSPPGRGGDRGSRRTRAAASSGGGRSLAAGPYIVASGVCSTARVSRSLVTASSMGLSHGRSSSVSSSDEGEIVPPSPLQTAPEAQGAAVSVPQPQSPPLFDEPAGSAALQVGQPVDTVTPTSLPPPPALTPVCNAAAQGVPPAVARALELHAGQLERALFLHPPPPTGSREDRGRSRSGARSPHRSDSERRRSSRRSEVRRRRRNGRSSRGPGGSRRSHRSRSSRWNSPSSASESVSDSGSSSSGSRRHRRRGERAGAPPAAASAAPPAAAVGVGASSVVVPPVATGSGECNYSGAWGAGGGIELVPVLRALAEKLSQNSAVQVRTPPTPPPLASVHKGSIFCGISPLGAHVDLETRERIWANGYVDIWSLVSVDQHTVDKERRVADRPYDRKPRVAKTMCNWLQAFSVLGCIMGEKHPERCSELFIYQDMVYSSYKSHGGVAWWRYDEEFRRRLALQPDMGWGVKATDVWLRLMLSPRATPFQSGATAAGSGSG